MNKCAGHQTVVFFLKLKCCVCHERAHREPESPKIISNPKIVVSKSCDLRDFSGGNNPNEGLCLTNLPHTSGKLSIFLDAFFYESPWWAWELSLGAS